MVVNPAFLRRVTKPVLDFPLCPFLSGWVGKSRCERGKTKTGFEMMQRAPPPPCMLRTWDRTNRKMITLPSWIPPHCSFYSLSCSQTQLFLYKAVATMDGEIQYIWKMALGSIRTLLNYLVHKVAPSDCKLCNSIASCLPYSCNRMALNKLLSLIFVLRERHLITDFVLSSILKYFTTCLCPSAWSPQWTRG